MSRIGIPVPIKERSKVSLMKVELDADSTVAQAIRSEPDLKDPLVPLELAAHIISGILTHDSLPWRGADSRQSLEFGERVEYPVSEKGAFAAIAVLTAAVFGTMDVKGMGMFVEEGDYLGFRVALQARTHWVFVDTPWSGILNGSSTWESSDVAHSMLMDILGALGWYYELHNAEVADLVFAGDYRPWSFTPMGPRARGRERRR